MRLNRTTAKTLQRACARKILDLLATRDERHHVVAGEYFYHLRRIKPNSQTRDPGLQDRFISICAKTSHVTLSV
jgi:hypothetical protein